MLKNPWLGVAILVPTLLGMLFVVRALRARFALHPEVSRKAAHVGLGLGVLTFPFLFDDVWPVLIIGGATIAVLAILRWTPLGRTMLGGVVHGVQRRSGGDFYFPIAATGLYVLTSGDAVLFGIPILTLALADAVAAVVGVHYGRMRYATDETASYKSLEGSVAFFTVAFLATHIPLLVFTTTGRLESVLIGLIFGMIVMLLEAVALRGTDNLLIPFGGYLLLAGLLQKPARHLALALLVTLLLLVLVVGLRRRRTLSDSAVIAAVLFGFACWAVGGWRWLVPPVALFLSYTVLWPRRRLIRQRPHDLVAVAAVFSSALLWLLLAFVLERPDLLYPFTISVAAHLCFVGITWYRLAKPRLHPIVQVAASAVVAWLAIFPLYVVVVGRERGIPTAGAALLWLVVGGIAFVAAIPANTAPGAQHPWMRQSLLGLAVSLPGLMLLPALWLR
ncbi:MAG TPA: hypothetical protein VHM67_10225 [Gemmatimonadaceae bacterium]|nr:hypothetical protein [Gemmatimonadaceae bacterium]